MTEKVLCVDDDRNILEGYQRQLRKSFPIEVATGALQGLEVLQKDGPFAVVVSDLQMPDMDGVTFLKKVWEQSPDTVRIMLTGHADLATAIQAVNQGHIFRFLTKPCSPHDLGQALNAGLEQHRLITAQKELLEQTLSGSMKVLCDILALVNPEAFGRSSRVARYVVRIAQLLGIDPLWPVQTAAMLSQIGCVILPQEVLTKVYQRAKLTNGESELFNQHPLVGGDLLRRIPRMKDVADIIAYQDKCFDGYGGPTNVVKGGEIPLGSRILKVALDFDALQSAGRPQMESYEEMLERKGWYDPAVLVALKQAFAHEIQYESKYVLVTDLVPGMLLGEDVKSSYDVLLIAKGQEVTSSMIARLRNFTQANAVKQPIRVFLPLIVSADSFEEDPLARG